ncbi:MAG: hypothetical protein KDD47_24440 [Acidobacteria bacterium]|nr:hypothetical protein [Acidobacteriota bacterium]
MKKLDEMIRIMVLPELSPRSRQEVERVLGDLRGLRRSYRELRPVLRRQKEEATARCEELLSHPPEERSRRIRLTRHRLRSRPLVEELLRRSLLNGYEDPSEARHLADLASQVTLELFASEELAGGSRGLNDLQALVLAHQGHASRRDGQWAEAVDCFHRSLRFLSLGSGSPRVLTEVKLLHSQYLRDAMRWSEAEAALREIAAEAERSGEEGTRGRTMVLLASVLRGRGEGAGALEALLEACVLVDEDREPEIAAACWNQLAAAYAEAGQRRAAEDLLVEAVAAIGELPRGSGAAARRDWSQARALAAREAWPEAEAAFRDSWNAFLTRGLRVEGALVSLGLGASLAAMGRDEDLRQVAEETCRSLAGAPLARELSSSVGQFLEACRAGRPALETFDQLQEASRRSCYLGDWGG